MYIIPLLVNFSKSTSYYASPFQCLNDLIESIPITDLAGALSLMILMLIMIESFSSTHQFTASKGAEEFKGYTTI